MRVVGITGGIGSGKSTVAAWLTRRGVPVIDADQVARDVVAPGSAGLSALVTTFGEQILRPDGSLDRPGLGRMVVDAPEARAALEAITHPLIHEQITRRLEALRSQGAEVAAVEAALMVETGSFQRYDAVLLIDASEAVRAARVAARQGWELAQARAWLDAQLSNAERRRRLDEAFLEGGPPVVVVENDDGPEELAARLEQAWATLHQVLTLRT